MMEENVMKVFSRIFFYIGVLATCAMIFLGAIELWNRMRLSNEIRPIMPKIVREYED